MEVRGKSKWQLKQVFILFYHVNLYFLLQKPVALCVKIPISATEWTAETKQCCKRCVSHSPLAYQADARKQGSSVSESVSEISIHSHPQLQYQLSPWDHQRPESQNHLPVSEFSWYLAPSFPKDHLCLPRLPVCSLSFLLPHFHLVVSPCLLSHDCLPQFWPASLLFLFTWLHFYNLLLNAAQLCSESGIYPGFLSCSETWQPSSFMLVFKIQAKFYRVKQSTWASHPNPDF